MDINIEVGERISNFRHAKSLTQQDMASKLGMSRAAYNQLENGNTQITIEKIYEIASILNSSIIDFLPGLERNVDPSIHRELSEDSIAEVLNRLENIKKQKK